MATFYNNITTFGALTVGVNDVGHDVKFFGATSGKYMLWDESHDRLHLTDSTPLYVGDGGDMSIHHDGTANLIDVTSTLNIATGTSGVAVRIGHTTSETLVNDNLSVTGNAIVAGNISLSADGAYLLIGAGNDLQFLHNGSDSAMINATGDLYIQSAVADKDIIFQADNGSGGGNVTTYLTLDGSATTLVASVPLTVGVDDTGHDVKFFGATSGKYTLWDESADRLILADDTLLALGSDSDMQIYHTTSGNNSYIVNYTGSLIIQNSTNDDDIVFKCDNGSGGNATYFTIDGSAADGTYTYTTWVDSGVVALGAGNDLKLWHNGTNSYIKNETGSFNIVQATDDGDLVLKCDNQSGGTAAYITLDGSTGWTTMNVPIHLIAQGSTPTNPGEGQAVIWLAEDGNINAKITLEEQTSTVVIAAFGGG